jgi:hypothetical protein
LTAVLKDARTPSWLSRPMLEPPPGRARLGAVKLDRKVREAFRAFGRVGGKKGGPKGGKARMAGLTDAERRELARKAARARWKKAKKIT